MNTECTFRLNKIVTALGALGLACASGASLAVPANAQIDLKLLVITNQADNPGVVGDAPQLEAVKAILDRIGTPYDVYVYDNNAPALPVLETGDHAKYQGIILPLSDYRYMNPFAGGPTAQAIARYQFKYGVRVASLYAWPGDTGCLQAGGYRDTSANPLNTTFTATGQTTFPYMNAGTSAGNPLTVSGAWTYFSAPASPLPAGATVTPLLQGTGANNTTYSLIASCGFNNDAPLPGDNTTRQILAATFDNNPYLIHSMTISYGIVNWVAKGIFLGDRHVYMDPQVDDIGLPNDSFPYAWEEAGWYDVRTSPWTLLGNCPLGGENPNTGTTPCEYRITGADLDKVVTWQNGVRNGTPNASALRLNMMYNGAGFTVAFGGEGQFPPDNPATPTNENQTLDTLTARVNVNSGQFKWTNHTYDHELMEAMTYDAALNGELNPNHTVRNRFNFSNYTKNALVTPEISGLYNSEVLRAMATFGTNYVVSDTSRPTPPVGSGCARGTWPLPGRNSGKYNCVNQSIYEVPRYPTALFYNVSTPTEWTAEYNHFYGANGIDPTRWGFDLTYPQVLDKTSDMLLSYLLTYDLRPLMFHAGNLRAYDGTKSLLGDLINTTLTKYNTYYKNLPIRSPGLRDTGDLMKRRQVYNESSVTGVLRPGNYIVVGATRSDGQSVVVPVTGVSFGTSRETYGGQSISFITLSPGNNYSTTITPAPAW
jgi:hypothetical protein